MDKYEYKLKLDQMKSLTAENRYKEAAEIADTINWHKIKNVNALIKTGEIYEKTGRYEESRDILLAAYDRSPIGRMIIYRLAKVAVKMENYAEAKDYYQEFVEIAPHDNLRYVLKYQICKAQGADIHTLIGILEELKEQEYSEEWAFELACLYHKASMSDKCIDACDELILWFGDGPYVERALELKMLYQPLTRQQEEKYRQFRQKKEGIVEVRPEDNLESGEIVNEPVQIPNVKLSAERFNTQNLQEELQKSMQQIMDATERETVDDSMDNIKKLVEDIPYLQIPREEILERDTIELPHIETDAEIDDSLKTNFKEFLAEDHDGQMSLLVSEKGHTEPQVTGQMSIDEVLSEWEKTKRAAEAALQKADQKKLESAKARALQEAGDIMERLADVIPKLDSGLTPRELLEEQYLGGEPMEEERAVEMVANMNQLLQQEIDRLSNENAQMDEQIAAAGAMEISGHTEEIKALEVEEPANAAFVPEAHGFSADEAGQETIPEGYTEEVTELCAKEEFAGSELSPEINEFADGDIPKLSPGVSRLADRTVSMLMSGASQFAREEISDLAPEELEIPELVLGIADLPLGESEEMLELAAEVSELASEKEDVDSFLESELAAEVKEFTSAETKLPKIAEPEMDGRRTIRNLSKEQREIFTYFIPIKGMEKQLCQAMTGAVGRLMDGGCASTGNMIIQGGQGSGKTVLATSMIKALQKEIGRPNGRIGKIEASALNQKDIAALLKKVAGGCLIIERAGEISRESAIKLSTLLGSDESGVLVIIEDTHRGIDKALSKDAGFASRFSEKITIPIFTSDELVSFARSYADELGYAIDEMGVLALYNSLSNIQKLDQATTLSEVKEIVDRAIARAERGGLKKAFSIITSRRYNEDDYVILHEKDFSF